MTIMIPLEVVSECNRREHHMAKARRVKRRRGRGRKRWRMQRMRIQRLRRKLSSRSWRPRREARAGSTLRHTTLATGDRKVSPYLSHRRRRCTA